MRIAGLCLTMGLLALSPVTAAANVTVRINSTDGLRIGVFSSESDVHVALTSSNTKLKVTELGNRQITPVEGCERPQNPIPGETFVVCDRPTLNFVTFLGSNDRDRLVLAPGVGDCQCSGGRGNDEIRGSDGADLIRGGGGFDDLRGGDGDDVLEGGIEGDTLNGGNGADSLKGEEDQDVFDMGGAPDGPDTLDGGDGAADRVDYSGRRTAIAASIDGSANDGATPPPGQIVGERDNIATNVEDLTGGAGGDTLTGNPVRNRLIGGGGNDTIRGGTPSTAGPDDYLEGGLGADLLKGEGGDDTLNARDAIDDQVTDTLSCGSGPGPVGLETDTLEADVRDDDTRGLPTDCESVSQGMVGEDPNVHIRSVKRVRGEGLVVALHCPRKARTGCEGNLAVKRLAGALARGGGFGERVKYEIARGKRTKLSVPSKARRGALVRIRSLEKGRLGPRTTFRTLEVKR